MENNDKTQEEKPEEKPQNKPVKLSKSGKFSIPGSGFSSKYGGANSFGGSSGQGPRSTKRTGKRGDK